MFDIVYLDHGNVEAEDQYQALKEQFPHMRKTRFFGDYLETLKRLLPTTGHANTKFIWVISSICDYSDFDFTWEPVPWQDYQLHVFPSECQKFGDTFLVPVSQFIEQTYDGPYETGTPMPTPIAKLEYYKDVNWRIEQEVPRFPYPVLKYGPDQTPFNITKEYVPRGNKYVWLVNEQATLNRPLEYNPTFWKKPKINVFKQGGDVMLVPTNIKQDLSTQLYDYDNILYHEQEISTPKPQDIVFISYDEINADLNWDILKKHTDDMNNHRLRTHGIEGMVPALKVAAEKSSTDHFFAVFAKTEIHPTFNFSFQPDRLAEPKHYIFDGYNPTTGLTYGHAGIVMYNRRLVLDCTEWGTDFTMSFANEHVPELSCINNYAVSPYQAWRTAFRECAKLANMNTIESTYRLEQWTTIGNGEFGEWSIKGANDGVKNSSGDLMVNFDWNMLRAHFVDLYGELD